MLCRCRFYGRASSRGLRRFRCGGDGYNRVFDGIQVSTLFLVGTNARLLLPSADLYGEKNGEKE